MLILSKLINPSFQRNNFTKTTFKPNAIRRALLNHFTKKALNLHVKKRLTVKSTEKKVAIQSQRIQI